MNKAWPGFSPFIQQQNAGNEIQFTGFSNDYLPEVSKASQFGNIGDYLLKWKGKFRIRIRNITESSWDPPSAAFCVRLSAPHAPKLIPGCDPESKHEELSPPSAIFPIMRRHKRKVKVMKTAKFRPYSIDNEISFICNRE